MRLTGTVVTGVGANVLEDEGACGGNEQHLEHEVVQRLKENLAECLGLEWRSEVVTEELLSGREVPSQETVFQVCFKLVTDAFDACTKVRPNYE